MTRVDRAARAELGELARAADRLAGEVAAARVRMGDPRLVEELAALGHVLMDEVDGLRRLAGGEAGAQGEEATRGP